MKCIKCFVVVSVLQFVIATCLVSTACADDYDTLAKALKDASVEVNKLKIPDLIYKLDQETARSYFQRYFADNRMNHALKANIGYPICCWGSNHETLQKAIAPVLISHLQSFFSKRATPATINSALQSDKTLHNHLFYILVFLADIAHSEDLERDYKLKLQESLDAILKSSRLGDLRHSKIDNSKYPYVNSLKTQFLLTSFSFAKATDNFMGISRNISLPGLRRQLLVRYGVLVIDNGAFDNKQLRAIQTYMCAIPPHVRIPVAITCFDRLVDRDKNKEITVHNFRCRGAFNVFGLKVGASLENQFPEDYKSVETDIFTIVVAHEYNHNVDSIYVKETKVLEAFKDGLIKKAGHNKQNYLRSMCGDGFFEKSPQEFIASLANQYFCSSLDTLSYALKKAEEGNLNHINQFILMASIYSDETKTYFYSIDKQGRTKVTGHPAKRKDGLITALSVRTKTYRFIYAGGVINEVVGL